MKRIKTVNGYAIYQSMTRRDADNYGCQIGNYNLYVAQDIRDYGLSYSYASYDDIDSLATAIELANGSNYAVACALADELSDSTVQDMDMVLELERRLDAGESIEYLRDCWDEEAGRLFATPQEAEAARDDAALADGPDGDLEDVFEAAMEDDEAARSSHASYAVLRDPDDGQYHTIAAPCTESLDTQERRDDWLLTTVSKHYAFSDCGGYDVIEIVVDGRHVEYVGWQPGMLYEYRDCETGEIVWSESFPEWDH